jgi:hypothetical protein
MRYLEDIQLSLRKAARCTSKVTFVPDSVKTFVHLKERELVSVDWIHLAQDRYN